MKISYRDDGKDTAKWATILLFAIPAALAAMFGVVWLLSLLPWPTWVDEAGLVVVAAAALWLLLFMIVDASKHG